MDKIDTQGKKPKLQGEQIFKLTEWYFDEDKMQKREAKFPMSTYAIADAQNLLRNSLPEGENIIDYISENSEQVAKMLGSEEEKISKMIFCEKEKIKNYKVHIKEGKLQHCINGIYIPIGSIDIFKKQFERTPIEDAKYLESKGVKVSASRKGKCEKSCFIVDTKGDLYISPYRPQAMHHTFVGKEELLTAGTMKVKDGKIVYLNNYTGHFQASHSSLVKVAEFIKNNAKDCEAKDLFHKDFNLNTDLYLMTHKNFIEVSKDPNEVYFVKTSDKKAKPTKRNFARTISNKRWYEGSTCKNIKI